MGSVRRMNLQTSRIALEICVDTPDGLAAAIAAGADRVELCSGLDLGGLSPSPGLIRLASASPVPVYAMIRPRAGDFVFGAGDKAAMLAEIAAVREAGLAGVVLGASRPDLSLDEPMLAELRAAAHGLGSTLHRAFDLVPDMRAALEAAVRLGFERILTSGGALDAPSGAERLQELQGQAAGRISIMPGSGVRPDNVADLVRRTGVREVHASARRKVSSDLRLVRFGFASAQAAMTDIETIRALHDALAACHVDKQSNG